MTNMTITRRTLGTNATGAAGKPWRAFLSAIAGQDGKQVNAIDRVGNGPWYDRLGRTFALTRADLLMDRPRNADPAIANDFPNEDGVPNHAPDPGAGPVDNHDFLRGSNNMGQLYSQTATCNNWTGESGCSPGVNLLEQGGPKAKSTTVGSGGGYGGFYCFSLTP
jgi:hypothetical protein